MNSRTSTRRASGYSIFELVVVMTIVAIIAAVAIPSFKYVTASNRISSEINALLADMRYARSEAVKEGLPVTLCASADGATCSAASNSWQSGWIVFSDPNNTQTVPNGAVPLHIQPALSLSFNNSTDVMVVDHGIVAVTFNRQGFGSSIPATTAAVTMALRTSPEITDWTRCLQITAVGQLAIEKNGTGNCT